ncbi:MAG: serine protease [Candidatus Kerfeldbacteria bacterium]|nr:serine protease [Candidatus Kerfeldbacteria bacterium]
MKPRPTPTSPKSRPTLESVDELFQMKSAVTKPGPRLGPYLVLMVFLSVVFSQGVFIGLRVLAGRYPSNPVLRYFSIVSQPNERVITREVLLSKNGSVLEILRKVLPSLAVVVKSDQNESEKTAGRQGLAVFLSTDGVAVTTSAAVSAAATTSLSTEDQIGQMVSASAVDPATGLAFLQVKKDSTSLPFVPIDDVTVGMPVYVVRFDPYSGGASAVPAAIASLRDRPGSQGSSDVEESDKISRRLRLGQNFDSSWLGAAVVDVDSRLVGLLAEVEDSRGGLVLPISWLRGQITRFRRAGRVARPSLGVRYIDLALAVVREGFSAKGAYLSSDVRQSTPAVPADSAAARAGLRAEDVILAVGEEEVGNRRSLSELLAEQEVGSKIMLKVRRKGTDLAIPVTLGAAEAGE